MADNTEEAADSPTIDEGGVEPEVVEKSPEEIRAEQEKLFTQDDEGDDYSLDFLSINEDDSMYAVPEDDTADFVGIGSLGHIIRKCFKELYRPGQDEDDMLMKKVNLTKLVQLNLKVLMQEELFHVLMNPSLNLYFH